MFQRCKDTMSLPTLRNWAALLFFMVTLLASTGCSGLTSAGLPSSAAHTANGTGSGSSSGSSSSGTSSSSGSSSGTTQATVSSTVANFGNVTVGSTTTQQIQVTNTGTANV